MIPVPGLSLFAFGTPIARLQHSKLHLVPHADTPNTEHRTPNTERQTPNAKRQMPNAKRRMSNAHSIRSWNSSFRPALGTSVSLQLWVRSNFLDQRDSWPVSECRRYQLAGCNRQLAGSDRFDGVRPRHWSSLVQRTFDGKCQCPFRQQLAVGRWCLGFGGTVNDRILRLLSRLPQWRGENATVESGRNATILAGNKQRIRVLKCAIEVAVSSGA